jgi:tetratricopeptide (TPR) repeat protein
MNEDRNSTQQLPSSPPDRNVDNPSQLAILYNSMLAPRDGNNDKHSDIEALYTHSLTICQEQFGADHIYTAQNLNNLAVLYESMGKYTDAESLYARTLSIREEQLGASHPFTVQSLNNLGLLYRCGTILYKIFNYSGRSRGWQSSAHCSKSV